MGERGSECVSEGEGGGGGGGGGGEVSGGEESVWRGGEVSGCSEGKGERGGDWERGG